MKKIWMVLLALLLAAGLVMMGCGGDDDDDPNTGELEEKVVFDMATDAGIQALAVGPVAFPADGSGEANPIAPLVRAGGDSHITVAVVENAGKKSFELDIATDWGAGLDLPFAAFQFRAGDVVTVTGEILALADGRTQLNSSVGGENAIGTANEEGAFTLEATLTAANISQIRGGNPAAIRLENRAVGMKVRIDNINITGMRPSTIVALSAPVITRTGTGISWEPVEFASGYKILNGTTELGTASATAAAFNITTPGDYVVTVVALGIDGVSSDSPASNALTFTVAPPSANVNATMLPINIGSNGIGFGGIDDGAGDYDLDLLLDSKFLVLEFSENSTNDDGFGGMQIAIQGNGDGFAWNQSNSGDWTSFANAAKDTVYAVFELANLIGYPTAIDDQGKIIFNHGIIGNNFVMAYLTAEELEAGAGDAAINGSGAAAGRVLGFLTRDTGLVFE